MIPNMIGKGKTLMTKGVRLTTEKHKELFQGDESIPNLFCSGSSASI